MSNLNANYLLRVDRLNRLRAKYHAGSISAREFREQLILNGVTDRASIAAELDNFRKLGDVLNSMLEKIRPER